MRSRVLFGFEERTGQPVYLRPWHAVFAGISGDGKTTVVKALAERLGATALIFETKPTPRNREPDFVGKVGTPVQPYLHGLVDEIVLKDLLADIAHFGMKREFALLITLCEGAKSLDEVYRNLRDRMAATKRKQGEQWDKMLTLDKLLGKLMAEIQQAGPTNRLSLPRGIGVMDLRELSLHFQQLVVQSCAEHISENEDETVLVIDEATKFVPENRPSAAKQGLNALTTEGRSAENWLWLSSQAITSLSKQPLKNVGIWCLGRQKEAREVQRTLEQLQIDEDLKPEPVEIRRLKTGYFYVSQDDWLKKVYALPSWLSESAGKTFAILGKTAPPMNLPPLPAEDGVPSRW